MVAGTGVKHRGQLTYFEETPPMTSFIALPPKFEIVTPGLYDFMGTTNAQVYKDFRS